MRRGGSGAGHPNLAAASALRYTVEELVGRPVQDLAPREPAALARWRTAMEASNARDEEVELRTRCGEAVAFSVSTTELRDRYGAPVGTVVLARDIRARKQAEAELREREDRYRSLFDHNLRRRGTRVLFMSGYTAEAIGERGVLGSDVGFVEKRFTLDELTSRVAAVLSTPLAAVS